MLKNYFKVAWRNLIKDKQFSFLNLIGLSTGLACALLIYLWVSDELSIDKFNKNDSRLYQVLKKNKDGDLCIAPQYERIIDTLEKYRHIEGVAALSAKLTVALDIAYTPAA